VICLHVLRARYGEGDASPAAFLEKLSAGDHGFPQSLVSIDLEFPGRVSASCAVKPSLASNGRFQLAESLLPDNDKAFCRRRDNHETLS
jgi:hypothetical protein